VVDIWILTRNAEAIARVRTRDSEAFERLIIQLQRDGLVQCTGSRIASWCTSS
jgi:hypothetical protein